MVSSERIEAFALTHTLNSSHGIGNWPASSSDWMGFRLLGWCVHILEMQQLNVGRIAAVLPVAYSIMQCLIPSSCQTFLAPTQQVRAGVEI